MEDIMKSYFKKIFLLSLGLGLFSVRVAQAAAGNFEISGGLAFNSTDYGNGDYSWSRRWGASVGFFFTDLTEVEYAFQDVTERTKLSGYEDTSFHDQINSINLINPTLKWESDNSIERPAGATTDLLHRQMNWIRSQLLPARA